ncbi:hypothetical protein C8R45DRAFT_146913 [Mycena sanguinolenta]|nr:hypothetical protein C8R45DRAFT_146913 [Mycena sanguinolenta]
MPWFLSMLAPECKNGLPKPWFRRRCIWRNRRALIAKLELAVGGADTPTLGLLQRAQSEPIRAHPTFFTICSPPFLSIQHFCRVYFPFNKMDFPRRTRSMTPRMPCDLILSACTCHLKCLSVTVRCAHPDYSFKLHPAPLSFIISPSPSLPSSLSNQCLGVPLPSLGT